MNVVVLIGTVSKEPQQRSLASGDEVVTLDVTTRAAGPGTESVPVTWFDPPASAAALVIGDEVVVTGRVRRRFYRTGAGVQSRTDVMADRVVPARHRRRSDTAIANAASTLQSGRDQFGPTPTGAASVMD